MKRLLLILVLLPAFAKGQSKTIISDTVKLTTHAITKDNGYDVDKIYYKKSQGQSIMIVGDTVKQTATKTKDEGYNVALDWAASGTFRLYLHCPNRVSELFATNLSLNNTGIFIQSKGGDININITSSKGDTILHKNYKTDSVTIQLHELHLYPGQGYTLKANGILLWQFYLGHAFKD